MENIDIRALVGLREELGEILEDLREKTARIEEILENLDTIIGAGSFSTADVALTRATEEHSEAMPQSTAEAVVLPKSTAVFNKARDLELATMQVEDNEITIIPSPHALYDIKRGAFARFFVERILGQYQQQDRERVESGEIDWVQAFDFEVVAEDGILQKVVIRNFSGEDQFMEIERTLRWALEKTYRAR
ncbi:MAG: hypothetical protein EAX81_01675 [Candidatus Thorarchaeota archaeon]|nr:hypothetical protein [Candidatus Thorarchaeota archaeon]